MVRYENEGEQKDAHTKTERTLSPHFDEPALFIKGVVVLINPPIPLSDTEVLEYGGNGNP